MPLTTPIRSPGLVVGYLLAGLLLLLIIVLALVLRAAWGDLIGFLWGIALLLSLVAFFFVSFWTAGLGVARYAVEDDRLQLSWGPRQHTILLAAIAGLESGAGQRVAGWRGVRWPGVEIGAGRLVRPDGSSLPLTTYATRPLAQQLLILTDEEAFGLSPADPDFAGQLEALVRAARASGAPAGPIVATPGPLSSPLWRDRSALQLLLGGLVLNLTVFAVLSDLSSGLPAGTARFSLPLIALLWWLVDAAVGAAFYRDSQQRGAALLVWSAGVVLQLGAGIALLALVS
jgi:hypothetical protein